MQCLLVPTLLLIAATNAQKPDEKPVRWEYAELASRFVPAMAGGVDAGGKKVASTPGYELIVWTTGTEEAESKGWAEVASKLGVKLKDGSARFQRMQVLNALGGAGWELADLKAPVPPSPRGVDPRGSTQLFKRPDR